VEADQHQVIPANLVVADLLDLLAQEEVQVVVVVRIVLDIFVMVVVVPADILEMVGVVVVDTLVD
jgi:hypothetical protein